MDKKRRIVTAVMTLLLGISITATTVVYTKKTRELQPDNMMIHKEVVISNTGSYTNLYANEIFRDRGEQNFDIRIEQHGKDLHIFVLAHKTSEGQVNQFVEWMRAYYSAEVANNG